MSSNTKDDQENPDVLLPKESKFSFWQKSPIDSIMLTSSVANMMLSSVFIYSLSGNARLTFLLVPFAVPFSIVSTIMDSKTDYENWKKTQHLREKGIPDKYLPLKVKYDWTEFDERVQQEKKKVSFTGTSEEIN